MKKLITALPIIAIAIVFGLIVGCGSDKKGAGNAPPCSGSACQDVVPPGGGYDSSKATQWDGDIRIHDKAVYKDFLKDVGNVYGMSGYGGICEFNPNQNNPYWFEITWNVGYADCDNWTSSARVQLGTRSGKAPTEAEVQIFAIANGYGAQQPLPLLRGSFEPINNNQAIEFRRNGIAGSYSYDNIIQIKSEMGDLNQGRILLRFYYNNKAFGYAEMTRL